MRSTKSFGLVIALIAVACGSSDDICSRVGSALNGFITKATPCYPNPPVIPFTAAQCTASLARCTDVDKRILSSLVDCLNALPTCTVPTVAVFATQTQACVAPANALSAACKGP